MQDFNHFRTTVDTYTGKSFRWNTTVQYAGKIVPCRITAHKTLWLHPDRVPAELLRELNAE